MSEYIEIEAELGDAGIILFHTNLRLTTEGRAEVYGSANELDEGSPVAQALAAVGGIETVEMEGGELAITGRDDADWHSLIADVTAALKDFFL